LSQLLSSFFDAQLDQIEFVIADNGTRNLTEPVVEDFRSKGFNIRSIYHVENMGVPRNLRSTLYSATGDYCWLMGDDDLVVSDKIYDLICLLKQESPDLLVVNSSAWNHDFTKQIYSEAFCLSHPSIPCNSFSCREAGIMVLTFVGSLILKNDPKYICAMDVCLDNDFCYILSVLTAGKQKVRIYKNVMVRQRMRLKQTWNKSCRKIFIKDLNQIYDYAIKMGYGNVLVKRWQKDYLKQALTRICVSDRVSSGRIDPEILRGLIACYFHSPYLWFVTLPLYLAPLFILKFLKRVFSWNRSNTCRINAV